MTNVHLGSVLIAAIMSSCAILLAMYYIMPALGLPKLDFAAITAGWVKASGRYAKAIGLAIFLAGGIGWTYLYAAFFPVHGMAGGMVFALIPFGISCLAVLPKLAQYRVLVHPLPGFIWARAAGKNALIANLVEHLIFGACLGLFYR